MRIVSLALLGCFLSFSVGCESNSSPDANEALRPFRTARARSIEATVNAEADCYLRGGEVTCWGGSPFMGDRKPRKIEGLRNPRAIASDMWTTCVLEDGGYACWNVLPGSKEVIHSKSLTANERELIVYERDVCTLGDDGVVCSYGAKHDGADENRPVLKNPRKIAAGVVICALDDEGAKCWGRALQLSGLPSLIEFDGAEDIVTHDSVVCLRRAKEVKCFAGSHPNNVLGKTAQKFTSTNADQVVIGMSSICALENGQVRCDGPYEQYGKTPQFAYASKLFSNGSSICALDDVGVHCWGPFPSGLLTRFRF